MRKIVEDRQRLCVILFFAALFLYGCLAFNDYGISVDETVERNSTLVTYKYLNPSVSDLVTDTVNFPELESLDSYIDRYYGVAVQLPMAVVEHLFGFDLPTRTVYLIRHFYTFLLFFLAVITFYFLGKKVTKSRWLSLLGAAMLVISPRMLAESFYNIKDIVFLSFVIYNLSAAVCFLERPGIKTGFWLALISALCTNVRVVGAVVIASCMAVSVIRGLANWLAGRKKQQTVLDSERDGQDSLLLVLGVSAACIGLYILSMPALWKNPVQELMNTIRTFSDFTNWDDIFLYRGFAVRGNDLPRSYLFVWIFISTPLLYLALFVTGLAERFFAWVRALWEGIKGKAELPEEFWYHILFGMVLVIPLGYVVLRRPTLYNGWRHFYFLYAIIIFYAMEGAGFLAARLPKAAAAAGKTAAGQWLKRLACGAIGGGMAFTLLWMIANHPYEYVYFNPLVRDYALYNFEVDYWAVSEAELFQYICDNDDRQEIKLWCTFSDYYKSILMLSEQDKQRLVYAASPMEADYAVCRDLQKTSMEQMERQFAFEEIHTVEVDGRTINALYRRTDEQIAQSTAGVLPGPRIFYSASGLQWQLEEDGGALTTDLGAETSLTQVSVRGADQGYLEGLMLYTSKDGVTWTEAAKSEQNEAYILYTKRAVFTCGDSPRYLKLTHEDGLTEAAVGAELVLETELYAALGSEKLTEGSQMIERVSGHENAVASANATDGNMTTRWQSEDVQKQGIAFDIVLDGVYQLSGIRLDTGESPWEYPRALRIFATKDEVEWTELPVETSDNMLFTFPGTEVKMLRLLTGNMDGMDVQDRWSIYEITLMESGSLDS